MNNGWPADESIFGGAAAVVFYTNGGGKQAFLRSPERIARMQKLADSGVGTVMIHQAVDFPDDNVEQEQKVTAVPRPTLINSAIRALLNIPALLNN